MQVQKRTATVQVDLARGETKAYQFEESTELSSFPFSKRTMLIIGGFVAIIAAAIALKVAGMYWAI